MKKNIQTPLVDELLDQLGSFKEPETDDFFYTRLRARLEEPASAGWSLPLKPVWVIGAFALMLLLNGVMLFNQQKTRQSNNSISTPAQQVAYIYDIRISSTTY